VLHCVQVFPMVRKGDIWRAPYLEYAERCDHRHTLEPWTTTAFFQVLVDGLNVLDLVMEKSRFKFIMSTRAPKIMKASDKKDTLQGVRIADRQSEAGGQLSASFILMRVCKGGLYGGLN